jgi:hypothetical protein
MHERAERYRTESRSNVRLIINFHVVAMLRIRGVLPLRPTYMSMGTEGRIYCQSVAVCRVPMKCTAENKLPRPRVVDSGARELQSKETHTVGGRHLHTEITLLVRCPWLLGIITTRAKRLDSG